MTGYRARPIIPAATGPRCPSPPALLNTVDLTLFVLLAYSTWRGYRRGVLSTLASFVAPVVGFLAAQQFSGDVALIMGVYVDAPESFLGFAAAPLTFLVVAGGVRISAAIASAVLGLGDSLFSSILGALAGGAASAFILGALVSVLHHFAVAAPTGLDTGPGTGSVLTNRARSLMVESDRLLSESVLGPRLGALADKAMGSVFENQTPAESFGVDARVQDAASVVQAVNLSRPDALSERAGDP